MVYLVLTLVSLGAALGLFLAIAVAGYYLRREPCKPPEYHKSFGWLYTLAGTALTASIGANFKLHALARTARPFSPDWTVVALIVVAALLALYHFRKAARLAPRRKPMA